MQNNKLDEDPAKLSRLFYLQLYSSVLNSEQESKEDKRSISDVAGIVTNSTLTTVKLSFFASLAFFENFSFINLVPAVKNGINFGLNLEKF